MFKKKANTIMFHCNWEYKANINQNWKTGQSILQNPNFEITLQEI
jgi:hypothetical protein